VQSAKLPPLSPNLNAHAECFVRTIKESCLERMIPFGEGSLRKVSTISFCIIITTEPPRAGQGIHATHGFSTQMPDWVLGFRGVIVLNAVQQSTPLTGPVDQREIHGFEVPVDVATAARFLGVIPSLVYAYVERSRFPISE